MLTTLGAGRCGQTKLVKRFIKSIFDHEDEPTIEDTHKKQMIIDGKPCSIEIIDTPTYEDFECLQTLWMRNGDGFILSYSITNKKQFHGLKILRRTILDVKEIYEIYEPPMYVLSF